MSDQEYAIILEDIGKMFKLYKNPRERVIDVLGLEKLLSKKYQQFWALQNINLKIKRGSKVALVGRNGAGKSTLLKLVTKNLQPTTGNIRINGKVTALMELGTGFHPEYSGKENIFASLSYSGIIGKDANRLYEEIVDFSELDDFIYKPVKTYSAGMYTRLAFATSTAVTPDILIIDEILGAGDAYFLNKSMERMKQLTSDGTTVLFVSHDISSVQKLCNEAVWIDRGKVILEGHILDVTLEYLSSVRKQEEYRLKARNLKIKINEVRALEESVDTPITYFHFITDEGSPLVGHPISQLKVFHSDDLIEEVDVGGPMDTSSEHSIFLIVDSGKINWTEPKLHDNVWCREFKDVNGEFQHALFACKNIDISKSFSIEVKYKDISHERVKLEYFDGEKYNFIGYLDSNNDNQWKTTKYPIVLSNDQNIISSQDDESYTLDNILSDRLDNNRIYGSGEVVIKKVRFLDEQLNEKFIFTSQQYKKIRIEYLAIKKIFNPVFVVAYYLMDGTCAMQLISNNDMFETNGIEGNGFIDIIFDPLMLGRGTYNVSVAIFKELDLLDKNEPSAYDLHDRMYEIKVEQPFGINVELGIINHPVRWGSKLL